MSKKRTLEACNGAQCTFDVMILQELGAKRIASIYLIYLDSVVLNIMNDTLPTLVE